MLKLFKLDFSTEILKPPLVPEYLSENWNQFASSLVVPLLFLTLNEKAFLSITSLLNLN